MIEAIREHLAQDGKRMTNLNKAPIEKLDELIDKYEIDIHSYATERNNALKMKRNKEKQDKNDALQKEANELYKSTERTKMLIYYCESLDDELMSLKQACLLELTDKFNWNTNSGSGYGTVGLWKIKNDLYNNCGTLEEMWRINQQYVYIQQKNKIKREELENEKMIKEIKEYVKKNYPILNKNYKMSFDKKGPGPIY